MKKFAFIFLAIVLILTSCAKRDTFTFTSLGAAENGVYTIDTFEMNFDYPADMYILSADEKTALSDIGITATPAPFEGDYSIYTRTVLFAAYHTDPKSESDGVFNSNITVYADKLENLDLTTQNESAYLTSIKTALFKDENSSVTHKLGELTKKEIPNGVMYMFTDVVTANGKKTTNEYYAAKKRKYMMLFVAQYDNETDGVVFSNIIDSVKIVPDPEK